MYETVLEGSKRDGVDINIPDSICIIVSLNKLVSKQAKRV